jgi:hypothetical protein
LFRAQFKTDYTGHTGTVELIDGKGISVDGCTLTFIASKEAICSLLFTDSKIIESNYIISVKNAAATPVVVFKSDFKRKY